MTRRCSRKGRIEPHFSCYSGLQPGQSEAKTGVRAMKGSRGGSQHLQRAAARNQNVSWNGHTGKLCGGPERGATSNIAKRLIPPGSKVDGEQMNKLRLRARAFGGELYAATIPLLQELGAMN